MKLLPFTIANSPNNEKKEKHTNSVKQRNVVIKVKIRYYMRRAALIGRGASGSAMVTDCRREPE